MDAKTAVEYLRRESKFLDKSLELKSFSMDGANLIADYIEQQAQTITELRAKLENVTKNYNWLSEECSTNRKFTLGLANERVELLKKIEQQERYAELGRLAIADFKENMDNIRDFTDKNEANSLFIEKRSEVYKSERKKLLKVEECE